MRLDGISTLPSRQLFHEPSDPQTMTALALNSPNRYLMHQVMANEYDPDSSWISVMCPASRFQITVLLDDLRRSSSDQEYSQLVTKSGDLDNHDDDAYAALSSRIVEPCFTYFRDCTPHVPKYLTFEAFYYCPSTYHLKLVGSGPTLYPEATQNCHTIDLFVLMTRSRALP